MKDILKRHLFSILLLGFMQAVLFFVAFSLYETDPAISELLISFWKLPSNFQAFVMFVWGFCFTHSFFSIMVLSVLLDLIKDMLCVFVMWLYEKRSSVKSGDK